MRKLSRPEEGPECLEAVPAGTPWSSFGSPCKPKVRQALEAMNMDRGSAALCSYCESLLVENSGSHIEHLFPKSEYPDRTYRWDNLYLSCQNTDHCGHYKDSTAAPDYDPADLIRPDIDSPDGYLHFHSSGEVTVRGGLSDAERHRAQTTIDVLNLNAPSLIASRHAVASQVQAMILPDLELLDSLDEDELSELFSAEIESFRAGAHPTTARHFFA
ncbi:retron system putative HNH endonuclease [Corynebacterium variabile]|uniref:retron system putative HNH endonuclease n=1 Tax=Corynebacterium variabile TaxID=1727 RepID=UPI002896FB70|nr:retron system putative HNH endonuclease [Corynebacterium variabile]